jgi:hypothetical protein
VGQEEKRRDEMTIKDVQERIAQIKDIANDDESAHSMEDSLYRAFVAHVSKKSKNSEIKRMARAILRTKKISFYRWTA